MIERRVIVTNEGAPHGLTVPAADAGDVALLLRLFADSTCRVEQRLVGPWLAADDPFAAARDTVVAALHEYDVAEEPTEGDVRRLVNAAWTRYAEEAAGEDPPSACGAVLYHGPGHQSKAPCERFGPHDVHEAHYGGGQLARWRDGSYTDQLRARGIDLDPGRYPESMGMTGAFDEPPQEG